MHCAFKGKKWSGFAQYAYQLFLATNTHPSPYPDSEYPGQVLIYKPNKLPSFAFKFFFAIYKVTGANLSQFGSPVRASKEESKAAQRLENPTCSLKSPYPEYI